MQRIMVDLPEPDGPQTTTRSPWPTVMLTSRSTCIAPYHLLTLSSTMAGTLDWPGAGRSIVLAWLMLMPSFVSAARCG